MTFRVLFHRYHKTPDGAILDHSMLEAWFDDSWSVVVAFCKWNDAPDWVYAPFACSIGSKPRSRKMYPSIYPLSEP